jgi:outer membrane autotransporter protein
MYHVNNANASDTTNDAILITGDGNANLGGGAAGYLNFNPLTSVNEHARPYDFSKFVVVDTGSGGTVTGPFGHLESSGGLNGSSSYGGGPMYLTQINQPDGNGGEETVVTVQTDFAAFAHNPNEYAVGHYLDTFATPGNEGNLSPALISTLITLSQAPDKDIAGALALITPEDYASLGDQAIQNSTYESQQIFGQIDSAFSTGGFNTGGLALLKTSGSAPDPFSTALEASLNTSAQMAQNVASLSSVNFMDDTSDNGAGSPPVPEQETPESQLSGFVSGDIVMSTLPEGNSLGQPHYTTGGVTAGIDYRLNENWVVGGYFNYGYTDATLDYLGSHQQSSSYSPGLFVGYENGPWYVDALGSYTYNNYRIDRNFSMPGAGTATGKPTSNQFDLASLAGFYVPVARNVQVGPAGGFAYTYLNSSSFSETGSPLDLTVSSHTVDSLRSLLGGQAKIAFSNSTMPLDVNFNAFWQHEFLNGAGGFSAGLNNVIGGGTFLYTGTGPTRDSALVGGGLSGQLTQNITLFANYESQIGDKNVFGQSIIAGLSVSFK